MLIDTHAHLNFKAFDEDLESVIKRAHQAVISQIIIPGAKIDSSKKAVQIANQFPGCFAAVGIHPHHGMEYEDNQQLVSELTNLITQKKVVAVGEIGLDYHRYENYPPVSQEIKSRQKELLLLQLDLAASNNLPVIIHCRESFSDLLVLLDQYTKIHKLNGVFHCFSGTLEDLAKILRMGFFVGLDGNITYPQNRHLQEIAEKTPLDRLLLETDSPYLTPYPERGKRNEPSLLKYTAAFLTEIFKLDEETIIRKTTENAQRLFSL